MSFIDPNRKLANSRSVNELADQLANALLVSDQKMATSFKDH